ncbi:MAG: pseudouridine synthase [Burkholderiaceae bacterium]|nr:pseudouridine synthase [Burkholderiaceae bacterium]MBR5458760.1 pseudouridine synthase [Burkholderiaceae bacterium]
MLEILYEDDAFIAINKPCKLLVHRSEIDRHETRFAIQLLRDQINRKVIPVHRLDKGTSGVLLFAFEPETVSAMSDVFARGAAKKDYMAVVRGWAPESLMLDHPIAPPIDPYIKNQSTERLPAQTGFACHAKIELPIAVDRYPQSRYSLVSAHPVTGRRHQIRKHLKHINHPIIGDSTYGKGVHNRMIAERFGVDRMLLHAYRLGFEHPFTHEWITIEAGLDEAWQSLLLQWEWESAYESIRQQ